jgi:hypothetical protein
MVAKKKVAKKTLSKKKIVAKPIRKIVRNRKVSAKSTKMLSFKLCKDNASFTSLKLTRQTLYWGILVAFIAVTQIWILKLQLDIANITTALMNQ